MTTLDDVAALVAINSVSGNEASLAAHVFGRLVAADHLDVERVGDNIVARTRGLHARRVIVAGHLDTVPGNPEDAVVRDGVLVGLGACDMKGSVAVMVNEALRNVPRHYEITWIFYAREEIARAHSGLLELAELRPDLLVGDAAILAEPTGGVVEAGCQGTLRLSITVRGARAHTSRPFTGRNAIHRLGAIIEMVASYEPRSVSIDGIIYTEQMQVVHVSGGIANNVVPDEARCVINHRIAPDRTLDESLAGLEELVGPLLEEGDDFVVEDYSPPAPPSLEHELIERLVSVSGGTPRAKVGWTDVATFHERGVPAANFGAGDPLFAHRSDEQLTDDELRVFEETLRRFLDQ